MTIAGMTVYEIAEYFLIYSVVGWCIEVIYHAVAKGVIVNRGFLNGPVCPIYGCGVLAVFALTGSLKSVFGDLSHNVFLVFLFGVALATVIELLGGWMLDKVFHARWWDYSDKPFNFHGYICLQFSLIWGVGIVIVVQIAQPLVAHAASALMPQRIGVWVMAVLYSLYLADVIVSALIMVGLNRRFAELDELRSRMRVVSDGLSQRIGEESVEAATRMEEARLQAALGRAELRQELEDRRNELEDNRRQLRERILRSRHFGAGRVIRAFPGMTHRQHNDLLEAARNLLQEKR